MEIEKGEVVSGIAERLKEKFPDFYIYKEPVEMGFKTPCFFINCDSMQIKKAYGTRYLAEFNVKVYAYADVKKDTDKLEEIRFKLIDGFDYVKIGGKRVSICKMDFKVTDKSLEIDFNLSFHIMREKDIELMETLIEKRNYV